MSNSYNENSIDYFTGGVYVYSIRDLKERYRIFHDPEQKFYKKAILNLESTGRAKPISYFDYLLQYDQRWGSSSAFWLGAEHYMPEVMGSPSVSSGLSNTVKPRGFGLSYTPAKPKLKPPTSFSSMMDPTEATRYNKYWTKYAPDYYTPSSRLDFGRISQRTGRFETSRVIYDKFGRQIYRVDFSNHMRPQNHSIPHLHQIEYGPNYSINGMKSVYNFY